MLKSKIDVISREIAARQIELDAFLQSGKLPERE
jgi:hypothetical protein